MYGSIGLKSASASERTSHGGRRDEIETSRNDISKENIFDKPIVIASSSTMKKLLRR